MTLLLAENIIKMILLSWKFSDSIDFNDCAIPVDGESCIRIKTVNVEVSVNLHEGGLNAWTIGFTRGLYYENILLGCIPDKLS